MRDVVGERQAHPDSPPDGQNLAVDPTERVELLLRDLRRAWEPMSALPPANAGGGASFTSIPC